MQFKVTLLSVRPRAAPPGFMPFEVALLNVRPRAAPPGPPLLLPRLRRRHGRRPGHGRPRRREADVARVGQVRARPRAPVERARWRVEERLEAPLAVDEDRQAVDRAPEQGQHRRVRGEVEVAEEVEVLRRVRVRRELEEVVDVVEDALAHGHVAAARPRRAQKRSWKRRWLLE